MRNLQKPCTSVASKVDKARMELHEIQKDVEKDRWNVRIIEMEDMKRKELNKWSEIEEKVLAQKAKWKWL